MRYYINEKMIKVGLTEDVYDDD